MAIKRVVLDDFDGKTLADDHKPTVLSYGNEAWNLYLSEKNSAALLKALEPFVKDAEGFDQAPPAPRAITSVRRNTGVSPRESAWDDLSKEERSAARQWLIDNGYPVGVKGVIKSDFRTGYDKRQPFDEYNAAVGSE